MVILLFTGVLFYSIIGEESRCGKMAFISENMWNIICSAGGKNVN